MDIREDAKPNSVPEDELVEITDKVKLKAYLDPFPNFPENYQGEKYIPIILRITDPDEEFDAGLTLGPIVSPKVSDFFNLDGTRKEEEVQKKQDA